MIINGQEIEVYTLDDDGQEVDRAVDFGKNPDELPTENSEVGVKSGGVFTAIKNAKEALERQIVNRNLLHNPYFRIDQRQGYVAPPNTNYYSDTALTTLVGQTSEYTTVTAKASGYNTIKISGTDYYVAVADCVRGYTGNGRNKVDRWYMGYDGSTQLLKDDGVEIITGENGTDNIQWLEDLPWGEEVTLSAKVNGIIYSGSAILPNAPQTTESYISFSPIWGVTVMLSRYNNKNRAHFYSSTNVTAAFTVSAVKLEHGSISTLEAEIASGAYDEDADLRECRKYLRVDEAQSKVIGNLQTYSANGDFAGYIPSSIDMKGIPTLTYENCYFAVEGTAHYPITSLFSSSYGCGGKATTSVPASTMGFLLIGDTGVTGRLIRSCEP